MQKNVQTTTQLHSSHTLESKAETSSSQFQQYMNCALLDVQAGFRKGRGTSDQIANIYLVIEKAKEFQKISYSALLIRPKSLTV